MAVTRHTYATREALKVAAGWEADTDDTLADRLIESHSGKVDELFHRHFFPRIATRRYDWPSRSQVSSSILWLDADLLEVRTFTASGSAVSSDDYVLGPDDPDTEACDRIELESGVSFGTGGQRSLVVDAIWGYSRESAPVGALASALDDSATTVATTGLTAAGVGDLLLIGDEALIVTDRRIIATVDSFELLRGAYGTTAASHSQGATVTKNVPPGLIRDLVIAECIAQRVQEDGGYNASVGPGGVGTTDRIALLDLRARCRDAYARTERIAL